MIGTLTEAAFTRQVIELAKLHGWRVAHFRPARTAHGWRTAMSGDVGFPDVVFVHPKRGVMVVAELKVGRNKTRPEQDEWLEAFAAAGVPTYVWRPDRWAEIEQLLRG